MVSTAKTSAKTRNCIFFSLTPLRLLSESAFPNEVLLLLVSGKTVFFGDLWALHSPIHHRYHFFLLLFSLGKLSVPKAGLCHFREVCPCPVVPVYSWHSTVIMCPSQNHLAISPLNFMSLLSSHCSSYREVPLDNSTSTRCINLSSHWVSSASLLWVPFCPI